MNNDLIKRVDAVLKEAAQHRYSVSRIYSAYNEALSKNDQPQTCASCLRNRVRELRAWRDTIDKVEQRLIKEDNSEILGTYKPKIIEVGLDTGKVGGDKTTVLEVGTPIGNLQIKGDLADELLKCKDIADKLKDGYIAKGVRRFEMENGETIDFTVDGGANITNGSKGTVKHQDGKAVKAGTHKTVIGDEIAVQPGGKATYKEQDLL